MQQSCFNMLIADPPLKPCYFSQLLFGGNFFGSEKAETYNKEYRKPGTTATVPVLYMKAYRQTEFNSQFSCIQYTQEQFWWSH